MPTFPEIVTTIANLSIDGTAFNEGSVGPFADGTGVRYLILMDGAAFKLRAFRSTDTGATWTEVDAANAPPLADDTGSPAPSVYEYYGVCRDETTAVRKLYVVYWHTDFTISLIPFDMAAQTWGTRIGGALTYRFDGLPNRLLTNFGVAHRASDNVVWMAFSAGIDGVTPVSNRVFGAKCDLTGASWGALVALGTTDDTDKSDWQISGMVRDSGHNMHLFFATFDNVDQVIIPPFISRLLHQVIHPNDSLSVTDQIDTVTGTARIPYQRISYPSISSSDELLFTYDVLNIGLGTFEVHAIRAIAADAPTWSNEIPAGPIQSWASNRGNAFKGTITLSGLDYIFYSKPPVGLNQTFAYITSPSSLGSTWGAEQQIGTVPLLNVASGAQPAAFNPSWALTLYYDATGALVSGEGYFEAAAAPTKRCLQ